MLKEIVNAILQYSVKTFVFKEKRYANKANIRKRRENNRTNDDVQPDHPMDHVKTHKIKRITKVFTTKVSLIILFLIFQLRIVNMIECVSVNNVRNDFRSLDYNASVSKMKTRDLKDKYLENNIQMITGESEEKAQELNKYNLSDNYYKERFMKGIYYDDEHAVGYPHDLASHSYHLKMTNLQLRRESHQFADKILKLGVLLPADHDSVFSLAKVLPIVEMAVGSISKPDGPLPGWKILVDYRDTGCSSVIGPLAAFEFYINGSADAFIGPGCDYVIAPVARYSGPWHIPVLTAGAQAEAFTYKTPNYRTLTRMMGSYVQAGDAIRNVFEEFNWRKVGMMYHNNPVSTGHGNSPCFLTLSAIFTVLQKQSTSKIPNLPFDENNITAIEIKQKLKKLSLETRSE